MSAPTEAAAEEFPAEAAEVQLETAPGPEPLPTPEEPLEAVRYYVNKTTVDALLQYTDCVKAEHNYVLSKGPCAHSFMVFRDGDVLRYGEKKETYIAPTPNDPWTPTQNYICCSNDSGDLYDVSSSAEHSPKSLYLGEGYGKQEIFEKHPFEACLSSSGSWVFDGSGEADSLRTLCFRHTKNSYCYEFDVDTEWELVTGYRCVSDGEIADRYSVEFDANPADIAIAVDIFENCS